jgi:hypothetical protein
MQWPQTKAHQLLKVVTKMPAGPSRYLVRGSYCNAPMCKECVYLCLRDMECLETLCSPEGMQIRWVFTSFGLSRNVMYYNSLPCMPVKKYSLPSLKMSCLVSL